MGTRSDPGSPRLQADEAKTHSVLDQPSPGPLCDRRPKLILLASLLSEPLQHHNRQRLDRIPLVIQVLRLRRVRSDALDQRGRGRGRRWEGGGEVEGVGRVGEVGGGELLVAEAELGHDAIAANRVDSGVVVAVSRKQSIPVSFESNREGKWTGIQGQTQYASAARGRPPVQPPSLPSPTRSGRRPS
jgi:hypothetical protein